MMPDPIADALAPFLTQCSRPWQESLGFPAAFLTGRDPALLAEGVEMLARKLQEADPLPRTGTPFVHLRLANEPDFKTEFQRLVYTLQQNAGFSNRYRGIVALDLSEWEQDAACKELDAALAYLKDTGKDRIYIFYAAAHNPEPLRSALGTYFTLETARLTLEKPMQQYRYALGLLSERYGVQVAPSASAGLFHAITTMPQDPGGGCVAAIRSYCRDIASQAGEVLDEGQIATFRRAHPEHFTQPKQDLGLIK